MIQKSFYIKTFTDGSRYPLMHISPQKYEMMYELGMYEMSKSKGVKIKLENIEKVLKGEFYEYELSTGDWCIVTVKKDISIISNGFDEFKPIEISTLEIIKLLRDWYHFLKRYEQGRIPNVIPLTKKDEWMVVRRSDMKEIKWDTQDFYEEEDEFLKDLDKWLESENDGLNDK